MHLLNDRDRQYLPQRLREEAGGTKVSEVSEKLLERFLDQKLSMKEDLCHVANVIGEALDNLERYVLRLQMELYVWVRIKI